MSPNPSEPADETPEAQMVTNWDLLVERSRDLWSHNKVLLSVGVASLLLLVILAATMLGGSEKAPDFTLTDTDGKTFSLSDYRGKKVVVLDLMATTCAPCKKVADDTLTPLYEKNKGDYVIISVSVGGQDSTQELADYADKGGYRWRHSVDTDKVITKYDASFIPKLVVINTKGEMVFAQKGIVSEKELAEQIEGADSAGIIKVRENSLYFFAIGAGVLAFFSPCSFPLLPGYMSYYLNTKHQKAQGKLGEQTARAALPAGLAAALGILLVFMSVAVVVVLISEAAAKYITLLEPLIGAIILVMGVLLLTDYQYYWLINPLRNGQAKLVGFVSRYTGGRVKAGFEHTVQRVTKSDFTYEQAKEDGLVGLFAYGVGYGSASAGCTAPIFIALLVASWQTHSLFGSLLIFFLYSFAAAVLMVAFTLVVAASEQSLLTKMKNSTVLIKKAGGVVLIIVGAYLIWFYLSTEVV